MYADSNQMGTCQGTDSTSVMLNEMQSRKKNKDEMCELIKMSRLEASELRPFIRRVQVNPEPSCIVASERQLNDLVRFGTSQFLPASGLCIDTTFNIGNFFVTPTTYKHKILFDRQYGKEPP